MPDENMHFPKADTKAYINSWDSGVRCAVMQGGQGDTKHWAFNDPVKREGKYNYFMGGIGICETEMH